MANKKVTYIPDSKVTDGALAGAAATILIWSAENLFQYEIPGYVAAALATLLYGAMSYATPERRNPS